MLEAVAVAAFLTLLAAVLLHRVSATVALVLGPGVSPRWTTRRR